MTGFRRLVVELELIAAEQSPPEGWVRAHGLPPQRFSGWSEMFATLQTLVSGRQAARSGEGAGQARPGGQPGHREPGLDAGTVNRTQEEQSSC